QEPAGHGIAGYSSETQFLRLHGPYEVDQAHRLPKSTRELSREEVIDSSYPYRPRARGERRNTMSTTQKEIASAKVEEQAGALVGRIFEAGLGFMELLTIYIGERLGLYEDLADRGPATAGQLATRAGINERYASEWLEQQAATGLLEVDDPTKPADERTYSISTAHAAVLADRESPVYLAYFGGFAPGIGQPA